MATDTVPAEVAVVVEPLDPDAAVPAVVRERLARGAHDARGTMAPKTVRAMRKGFVAFARWCERGDLCALPAEPYIVAAYVDDLLAQGRKPAGIRQAVWAIGRTHRLAQCSDPTDAEPVRQAVTRAARASGTRQQQAAPLGELHVAAIRATTGPRLADLRDLALLLLMRDLLARRSEAVALCVEDLERRPDGTGTALIRRSKTDQEGAGTVLFLAASTMAALCRWLDAAGITAGPIFRRVNKGGRVLDEALDAGWVPAILKRMAGRAGLDVTRVSGHSCRVGMAQDLVASGADTAAVQQAGRWKSPVMPARYVEHLEAGRGAVARYHQRRGD